MEVFHEFIETSTIHGLSYISTAKSKCTKCLWLLIVISGFSCSFYLINDSFNDWRASPIDTAISTHPISELKFPNVTVCPPKATNTALNYDLMMTQNVSLSLQDRETLKTENNKIFLKGPAKNYAQHFINAINPENLAAVFEGYHSFPLFKDKEIEMRISSENGSITSPGFGQGFDEDLYFSDQTYHYVLDLTRLDQTLGSGRVVVTITTTTGGASQELTYGDWDMFRFHNDYKSWSEAEQTCVLGGGQLASVLSVGDQRQVEDAVTVLTSSVWLGARLEPGQAGWSWVSGHQVGYNNWGAEYPGMVDHCVYMSGYTNKWYVTDCTQKKSFVCQFTPSVISGNLTRTYTRYNLTQLDLWWKYRSHQKLSGAGQGVMTGFRMTWMTYNMVVDKYPDYYLTTDNDQGSATSPGLGSVPPSDFWKQNHSYNFTLDTTKIGKMMTDTSSLALEVETGPSNARQACFLQSYTYTYHPERRAWPDAEQQCVEQGGHLASLHSDHQLAAVTDVTLASCDTTCTSVFAGKCITSGCTYTLLGGRVQPGGSWTWTDKSHWNYHTMPAENSSTCAYLYNGQISVYDCIYKLPFICQESSTLTTGIRRYTSNSLPSLVHGKYIANYNGSNTSLEVSGFRISWGILQTNSSMSLNTSALPKLNFKAVTKPLYKESNKALRKIMLMTSLRPVTNDNMTLLDRALEAKCKWSYENRADLSSFCKENHIIDGKTDGAIKEAFKRSSLSYVPDFSTHVVSQADLTLGTELFIIFHNCTPQFEAEKLVIFMQDVLTKHNLSTIIQTTVNSLRPGAITSKENVKSMKSFYKVLHHKFNLNLGSILTSLLSHHDLKTLVENDCPYLSKEIKKCVLNGSCPSMNAQGKFKCLFKPNFNPSRPQVGPSPSQQPPCTHAGQPARDALDFCTFLFVRPGEVQDRSDRWLPCLYRLQTCHPGGPTVLSC